MVGADLRAARREPSWQPGTVRLGDPALPTPLILSASTSSSWETGCMLIFKTQGSVGQWPDSTLWEGRPLSRSIFFLVSSLWARNNQPDGMEAVPIILRLRRAPQCRLRKLHRPFQEKSAVRWNMLFPIQPSEIAEPLCASRQWVPREDWSDDHSLGV